MDLLQTEEPLPERSDLLWKHNVGEGLSNGLQAQSPNVLDPSSGEDPGHVPPAEALDLAISCGNPHFQCRKPCNTIAFCSISRRVRIS